jgi:TrmH family RNA methyltransferase
MIITSTDNDKLKLVRKLSQRKHREREGLFVTEGEDLLAAGLGAGLRPELVLTRAGEDLGGTEVERELLDSVSALGSGTRVVAVWPLTRNQVVGNRLVVYLHGVGDPGNVGSIVRTTAALADADVVLGPGCADAYGPKALRASMGAIFAVGVSGGDFEKQPRPRVALIAHGGDPDLPEGSCATLCLGAEREGLPADLVADCDGAWTIPVRSGQAESLGVAAAAAIALGRIGSRVGTE